MTSVLNLMEDNKTQDFYAMVGDNETKPGELYIKTIGSESKNGNLICIYESAKEFVADIPKLFTSQFKAVLFYIWELETPDFKNNIEFCKAAKAQLDLLHIRNYFINTAELFASSALIKFDITVKFHETVLMLLIDDKTVAISEFLYTENGYDNIKTDLVNIDVKESLATIREKIIASSNPQKILLMYKQNGKPTANFLRKKVLKSINVFVGDTNMESTVVKFIIEWSKWLMDKSYIKYYVKPSCGRLFALVVPFENVPLIKADLSDKVPFKKSAYVSKINEGVVLTFASFGSGKPNFDGSLEIEQECHRVKVTLSVDAESFPTIDYDSYVIPALGRMPEILNESITEKVPFIGFYEDCSVICIYNEEEKSYKFLDAWNGKYGKALVMSFDAEKPLFGAKCFGSLKRKKSSIVYDLIKIMSMPADNIEVDERWPFAITNNVSNQVLLEFDNHNGERKAATPAFLMALFLKQHIKVIKKETGQSHSEFGFLCFHDFNEEEKDRVEKQLRESFKLLKVDCVFGSFVSD